MTAVDGWLEGDDGLQVRYSPNHKLLYLGSETVGYFGIEPDSARAIAADLIRFADMAEGTR